eukprot:366529-Chlamydomonas_euryale.AAC.2
MKKSCARPLHFPCTRPWAAHAPARSTSHAPACAVDKVYAPKRRRPTCRCPCKPHQPNPTSNLICRRLQGAMDAFVLRSAAAYADSPVEQGRMLVDMESLYDGMGGL